MATTPTQTTSPTVSGSSSGQLIKIASGKKDVVTKKDAELLFNFSTKEFVIVPGSQVGMINNEIQSFESFKPYMIDFFPESAKNEKLQAARIKAVIFYLEKFVQAASDEDAKKILAKLPQAIPEKTQEILKSSNAFKASSMKNGDIVRYLRFKDNRTVCLRKSNGQKLKKTYKLDTDALNKELKKKEERKEKNEENKRIEEQQNLTTAELRDQDKTINKIKKALKNTPTDKSAESTIFEKTLWDADTQLKKLVDEKFFEELDNFDAGINAEVLRVASDAKFGATFDLKKKNIKVGGKADGSVALFQSKADFKIYLPDYDGFDLVALLRKIDPRIVGADAKPIRLMLQIALEGKAFAGVTASIGLEAGAQLKSTDPENIQNKEAKFEAGVELFAGAKVSAGATISANMKLIENEKTLQQTKGWEGLGNISYGGYLALGIGADLSFKVGYWDGRFRMVAKAGVVVKAGAGTHISCAIDPLNIGKLVYTICVSLNFNGISKVFDEAVQEFYDSLMLNCFYTGQRIAEVSQKLIIEIERFGGSLSRMAEATLSVFQTVDNTFDDYVPGYTGYKQNDATFILLRDTYNYLKRENEKDRRRENAIRTVREAMKDKRWCYANWKIKANLIADMCTGSPGWFRFTQEDKENAILEVVNTFRNAEEAYKVEVALAQQKKIIDEELDGDQLSLYRKIRNRLK